MVSALMVAVSVITTCALAKIPRERESVNKNFFMSSGFHYTKFLTKILNIIFMNVKPAFKNGFQPLSGF
jgi:hypothetical protein